MKKKNLKKKLNQKKQSELYFNKIIKKLIEKDKELKKEEEAKKKLKKQKNNKNKKNNIPYKPIPYNN